MENKIIFREMLSEIKKAADDRGGRITKEEVRRYLSGIPLEEEHVQMVFSYLEEQNIRVTEEGEQEEAPEEQEARSLELYLEELQNAGWEKAEEEQELLHLVMRGDKTARTRLIESYLPLICEMAGEYEEEAFPPEDLIQEGNLGLLMAMEELGEFESPAACRAHLLNSISRALETAVKSSQDRRKMDDGIVSRVNHLNEAAANLERDLGHKVSAEELSAYLEMPLEEIRDILRVSGDQIGTERQ